MKTQPPDLTTQELKVGLAQARERVLQDARILDQDFRAAVSFKTWIRHEPWFWVAGALGVGFLLGVLSSKKDYSNF